MTRPTLPPFSLLPINSVPSTYAIQPFRHTKLNFSVFFYYRFLCKRLTTKTGRPQSCTEFCCLIASGEITGMRSAFVHAKMIAVPVEHFMGNPQQPDCLHSIGCFVQLVRTKHETTELYSTRSLHGEALATLYSIPPPLTNSVSYSVLYNFSLLHRNTFVFYSALKHAASFIK
jgi:hypothetical protein